MSDPLRGLDPLVGTWAVTADHPAFPGETMRSTVTFEWYEGWFLLQRSASSHPDFPSGVTVIGADDTSGRYTVCYADDRDVQRVYQMTLIDGVWRQWRDAEGFAQRFTGRFSAAGDVIDATWERSPDNETWVHDFDLVFRRVS